MQLADNRLNKNSMVLALRKYNAAVNHMKQTVLLPNLLRDVPSDELWDGDVEEDASQDLYQNYLTLKAIKMTVESGLIPLDDRHSAKSRAATPSLTSASLVEADQEALFHLGHRN